MREILFRGKRVDNGEWVEGYYCKWKKGEMFITYSQKEVDCIITWMSNGGMSRYEIDPSTLCQFTGLTDKNGKKIWENDVVEIPTEDGYFHLKWEDDVARYVMVSSGIMVDFDNYWSYEIEVIGNIFDNAELLEER